MELADLNDKQKSLIDPLDRKQFGAAGKTYDEAESGACAKAHKELQTQIMGWCNRHAFKSIFAPTRNKSNLPTGHPDCTIFGPGGRTLFAEIKVGRDVLSTDQEKVISDLDGLGHTVIITHTYEFFVKQATLFFFKDGLL